MPRNTFILVVIMAILVAVLLAANISGLTYQTPGPTPSQAPEATQPTPVLQASYQSTDCGIAFEYPDTFAKIDNPQGGAIFSAGEGSNETIAVTCQKQIPRPPLTTDKIESVKIGSISANLYHDGSAKDGTPIDKLIFHHPTRNIDVYLAGMGTTFEEIIKNLRLL